MLLARRALRLRPPLFVNRAQLSGLLMQSPKIGEKRCISPPVQQTEIEEKKLRAGEELNGIPSSSITKAARSRDCADKNLLKGARKRRRKLEYIEPCSHDHVYWHEVADLLGKDAVKHAIDEETDLDSPFTLREEVELEILRLSSNGEGLAVAPSQKQPWMVIVPFSLPGEKVRARIYRNARLRSFAHLLSVEQPNPALRDMSRVGCRYFEKCGGCQYQMLSYEKQLDLKRDVIVRAYQNFSELPMPSISDILPTAPSPLQYRYRTKITPHFEAPRKGPRRQKHKENTPAASEPLPEGTTVPIGFNKAGTRDVLDIEECPIATDVINQALGPMRSDILLKLHTYKKGASLLLRDSLLLDDSTQPEKSKGETHICVTDHKGKVRERVGDMLFEFGASSFFQNNNAMLPSLVDYVKEAIFPSTPPSDGRKLVPPTHLVDTYCGAGLFSIMLSPSFDHIAGIELSSESIAAATRNAELNGLSKDKISFRTGDAADIFAAVQDFPPSETAVIVDPPRKGCDENFLKQLLSFRSSTVVYVSCNVHTQARDVGFLLKTSGAEVERGEKTNKYVLESIRGFDLFPQTAHVESVAVLRLV